MAKTKKYIKEQIKAWSQVSFKEKLKGKRIQGGPVERKEIASLKSIFKKIKKNIALPKMLILGVTPELRDLALKEGFQVVAVDINLDVILKVSRFLKIKNRKKEIIIKGNWLEIPFKENYFDLIVGHGSFNNLCPKDHEKLFKKLKEWLKSKGYLWLLNIVYPEICFPSYQEYSNLYQKKKITQKDFHAYNRFVAFRDKAYNPQTKELSGKKVFQNAKEFYKKGILKKKIFKVIQRRMVLINHTILEESLWLKILRKYFKLLSIKQPHSNKYTSSFYKVFLCQKR